MVDGILDPSLCLFCCGRFCFTCFRFLFHQGREVAGLSASDAGLGGESSLFQPAKLLRRTSSFSPPLSFLFTSFATPSTPPKHSGDESFTDSSSTTSTIFSLQNARHPDASGRQGQQDKCWDESAALAKRPTRRMHANPAERSAGTGSGSGCFTRLQQRGVFSPLITPPSPLATLNLDVSCIHSMLISRPVHLFSYAILCTTHV